MSNIFNTFFKFCPKTGKFRGIKQVKGLYKLLFPIIGLLALIWILIRVIPKPSRINYPCVKTAMPFAAGFLGNIILFLISALAFVKLKKNVFKYQFLAGALLVTFAIGFTGQSTEEITPQIPASIHEPNQPMGEAKGIFPGRVVWIWNPDATNENCSPNTYGDGWFLSKNNNQTVIDKMLSDGLKSLTGAVSDNIAWDSIFIFFNRNKGKGEVGYQSTEKIFIKINATSSWGGNFSTSDLSKRNNSSYGISETSPQIILSVLRQLVNVAGVPQDKIYIGDPMKHIYKHAYDLWNTEFPDVHYLDHDNYSNLGREQVAVSDSALIFYSDRGKVLRTNVWDPGRPGEVPAYDDHLYSIFEEAEYVINVPMLKGHKRAGMTMFAKNHFGSHTRGDASHLHNGLIWPQEIGDGRPSRQGYGLYRVQVDLMGHYILGGKNLLYLMDALWAADQEISFPKKFYMQPFNHDWMSSIFLSLDPVAIESVGYDFLRTEFVPERPDDDGAGTYAQMNGADDYLHQTADSANWPDSLLGADGKKYPFSGYDPENDGTLIASSLGTHEHWNNSVDMKYSRNLGTGNGIELFKSVPTSVNDNQTDIVSNFNLNQNYPNPFNPSTTISWQMKVGSKVILKVYNSLGKEVATLVNEEKPAGEYEVGFNASGLASGTYFYRITAGNYSQTKKMILIK